ncbi:hypothetical protein ACFX13_032707 [Malus domestica]
MPIGETMFELISKQSLIILPLILAGAVSLYLSVNFTQSRPKAISPSGSEEGSPMAANEFGVTVDKNPTQSKLTELGISTWPKYVILHIPFSYLLPSKCLSFKDICAGKKK